MKYPLILFLELTSMYSFSQFSNQFSETPNKIKKYWQLSQIAWDKNDSNKAISYDNSIKNCIESFFIDDYSFETIDGKVLNTGQINKPILLLTSTSWCSPCMAEIKPLNKIVEQFSDSVQFIILFWDTKDKLANLLRRYNLILL